MFIMMKQMWNKFRNILLFLIVGGFLGFLLLILVFEMPVEEMTRHVAESQDAIMVENGTSSEILYGYSGTFDGIFTDCLMLQNAIYKNGHGTMSAAMAIFRQEQSPDQWLPANSLVAYLNGEHLGEVSYARYWHGYLVILKPLLCFLNYQEIKMLNIIILGVMLCIICIELSQREKKKYVWAFLASFFLMIPIGMVLSVSQAICAYIALGAMIFLLKKQNWIERKQYLAYFFMAIGMLTSYMDFLTYPASTLGMPLVLYNIISAPSQLRADKEGRWKMLLKVIQSSTFWGIGYAGMWAMKWIFGSVILHQNVLADAASTMQERTSSIDGSSRFVSFIEVIMKNIDQISGLPYKWIVVVTILILLGYIWKHKQIRFELEMLITYMVLAMIPFVWFAVTLNHSEEHAVFTFRILGIAAFAFFSFLAYLSDENLETIILGENQIEEKSAKYKND